MDTREMRTGRRVIHNRACLALEGQQARLWITLVRGGKPLFINPYKIKKVYQKQEKTFDNTQKDQQGEFERRRRAKEAFQQPP